MRREKSNYIIQSVSHALDVLEQFFGDADELGVTELSKRLKLHKNNVFRLLATLESRGYIEQNQRPRTTGSASAACSSARATCSTWACSARRARSWTSSSRQARETAYVAVLRRERRGAASRSSKPIARCASSRRSARPCRCTAPRPARRSSPSQAEEDLRALAARRRCRSSPSARPTDRAGAAAAAEVGRRRTATPIDMGEHIEDVRAVAVPIRDYTRNVVGALAVVGPGVPLPGRAHREGARAAGREGRSRSLEPPRLRRRAARGQLAFACAPTVGARAA